MTVIIAGSPRKGMYSDRLAEAYKEKKEKSIIFYARNLKGAPCKGCGYCKSKGNGICVQKDDMPELLEKAKKADKITIFSPVYWWQLTAQMKLVIDRLYPMSEEDWKGKTLTVVMNSAAADDSTEFELLKAQLQEMADYLTVKYRFLGVGTTDDEAFGKAIEKVKAFASERQ